MFGYILAATTGDVTKAGKADRPRARRRPRRARRRRRHRQHLRLDDPVGRPPARAARRAAGHPVARLRPHRGGRVLRPARLDPRVRPRLGENRPMLASNPLIQVTPGLMIWTIVCFLITFFVLKKLAFGPIQADDRRAARAHPEAIDEADNARDEARRLLEEHRKLIGQAKSESRGDPRRGPPRRRRAARACPRGDRGGPPAPARGDPPPDRAGDRTGARRRSATRSAKLSLAAAEKITRKSLTGPTSSA